MLDGLDPRATTESAQQTPLSRNDEHHTTLLFSSFAFIPACRIALMGTFVLRPRLFRLGEEYQVG